MTSLTYGYKERITPQNTNSLLGSLEFFGIPEIYFLNCPGISTLRVDRPFSGRNDKESERIFGFYTLGMLESLLQLAERSRLNIELVWHGLWFPGSDELNFINDPQVSFGFSFSSSGHGIDPVSW